MKIATLIARFPPTLAGAEIQCYKLCCWLAREGHQVTVLTQKSFPEQPLYERVEGFDVIRFPTCGGTFTSSLLYGLRALYYLITHERFDILHAHMIATPAMVASLASLLLRTPVLIKITGGRHKGDFVTSRRYALGRFKLQLFKLKNPFVVCPNKETFKEVQSFGISLNKLSYIPNGIDTRYFESSPMPKDKLREIFRWPKDAPIAIYVGRWAEAKGVKKILELWEKGVTQPDFAWHLTLVLSDTPPTEITNRIERLGERVHMAIKIVDPLPYYQASDLAILLSDGEGMSNFLLEAMACGLPTLTTQAAALPDMHGEKTGTYILSNDDLALEGLRYLKDVSRTRERLPLLGCAAQAHIRENYTLDHIGKCYVDLYHQMKNQSSVK